MFKYIKPTVGSLVLFLVVSARAQPYGLEERVPNTSLLLSTSGDSLSEMEVNRAFPNLTFEEPVYLTHAGDGTDRLFVVERAGVIKVFPNDDSATETVTFLDISDVVNSEKGEAGLLSIAFHPDYEKNGKFYIYYIHGTTTPFVRLVSRISEFTVSSDPDVADKSSERVLLDLDQPASNHNGGLLLFGPDGYLYFGLGDGGGGCDPFGNGQDPGTLFGALSRIDVDDTENGLQYAIPPDNPFVGNSQGFREEIWAYGLRNPWRFSFDPVTGLLWLADVGEGAWEEINLIEPGGNYGWNIMEGAHCLEAPSYCDASDVPPCDSTGLEMPIHEYDHSEGFSITGGFVYRGQRLLRLQGVYVYADYVTRRIWGLKYENGAVVENLLLAECPSQVSSFGLDESGELYIVGFDGRIFQLDEKPGNEPPGFIPETISESGLYSDIENQTPAPGIIPYTVNSKLWSDGALKTRFIALPGTTRIDFSQNGSWQFPSNAVLVKNFYLEMVRGNPDSRKIIETRFLVRRYDENQWDGFSYMWNDAATDAVLLNSSATKTYTIIDPTAPGGTVEHEHYFPSRTDCNACHTPAAGYVLGVRTAQINKDHLYDNGVTDNQLRSMNHIALFTEDIGEDYTGFPKLPDPLDVTQPLADRARSYLDANCSQCHRPGGTGRTEIDLRFSTPLDSTALIDVPPELGDLGIPGAARIKPGSPDSSIVYLRTTTLNDSRMPPLATSLVDSAGTAVLFEWIFNMGVMTDTLQHAGLDRTYLLHLPPSYDGIQALPMVIAMHGGFGSARNLEYQSQLNVTADSANFIVVYPEGVKSNFGIRTWNAGGCCGYAVDNNIDDVGFISALIDTVSANYNIDPDRIFATGMSNGGMMAYRLACELSEKIAAVAPVAATMAADSCAPSRAVPILHVHSFLDENVPYEGGVGSGVSGFYNPPLDSVFDVWSEVNACGVTADTVYNGQDYVFVQWTGCEDNADIHFYITHDGGHSWPGGNQTRVQGSDPPSQVLSANALMWAFFRNHPMPDDPSRIADDAVNIETFSLSQNYPNPFNPTTTIRYDVPKAVDVELTIYDILGRRVKTLVNNRHKVGTYTVTWNARDDFGRPVSSGVYFYRIEAGEFRQTRKLLLLK